MGWGDQVLSEPYCVDTYIGTQDSEVISAFDNMTLIELMSKLKFELIEALDSDGKMG